MQQTNRFAIVRAQDVFEFPFPYAEPEIRDNIRQDEPTPFQVFMACLMRRRPEVVTTMAGSAEWGGMPVEEIVAHGLWAVMLRVAETKGLQMGTERQVRDEVAPRVNRLVNAGLAIAYDSPEEAADTFMRNMRAAVADAIRNVTEEQPLSFQETVQLSAAQFFAGLIKSARTFLNEAGELLENIQTSNTIDAFGSPIDGSVNYVDADDGINSASALIDLIGAEIDLRITERHGFPVDVSDVANTYEGLRSVVPTLKRRWRDLLLLRRVPLRLARMPKEAKLTFAYVENEWVRTQIALAAIDAPDRDYLAAGEYEIAIRAAKEFGEERVLRKFTERMRTRGVRPDSDQDRLLAKLALKQVQYVLNASAQIDENVGNSFFAVIDLESLRLNHQEAYELAIGARKLPGLEKTDHVTAVSKILASSLNWRRINLHKFRQLLVEGSIDERRLLKGIAQMPDADRLPALQLAIERFNLDGSLLGLVLDNGAIEPTVQLAQMYLEYAPPATKPKLIARIAKELLDGSLDDEIRVQDINRLILSFLYLPSDAAASLFMEPELRPAFQRLVLTALFDPYDSAEYGLSEKEVAYWIDHVGRTTFHKYILCGEMLFRAGAYAGKFNPTKDVELASVCLVPWEKMAAAKPPHVIIRLADTLRASQVQVRRIVADNPEDDIVAWYYQSDKQAAKRLVDYRKARTAYYDRGGKPLKRPAKKSPKASSAKKKS